jgi:hypothetical protein
MSYKDKNNNFKTLSWWEKIRIRFIPIDAIAQSFPITRRIADILGRRRIWGEDLRRPDLRTRGITIQGYGFMQSTYLDRPRSDGYIFKFRF